MSDTGVWASAELDDEGALCVKVHCAAEWKEGECCTVGTDVTEALPTDLREAIVTGLREIIRGTRSTLSEWAKNEAMRMSLAMQGKAPPGTKTVRFEGEMGVKGELTK